jgi:hypothetical protein
MVVKWSNDVATKLRDQNPMLFLTGEKEPTKDSLFYFETVLKAKGSKKGAANALNPLDQTFMVELKGAGLTGASLLGKNSDTGTENTILQYMEARQKDRAAVTRFDRKFIMPYYVDLKSFGMNMPDK